MRATILVIAIAALIVLVSVFAPAVPNAVFNGLDLALGWLGPFWVVVLVSALTGLLFILAFPHVSAQSGIRKVKDRIKYNLLAIRIFQDNLGSVLKSTAGTLGWNFAYLGLNLIPMFVLAAPFMVIWFQLNALYAYQPLRPGDERIVVAELAPGVDPAAVELLAPQGGWTLAQGPVPLPGQEPRLLFTVRAEQAGSYQMSLRSGGETVTKALEVGTQPRRLARVRTAVPLALLAAGKDPIVFFGEPVLPGDSFVRSITLEYPKAPLGPFGGGEITIMLVFIVVSLIVGFGLKGVFGVEI
ncbi:MAG: hypothetical protein EYC70_06660 [Planctomycetota bacterium]|nr:MAG: hypothetical protein EYC70_06660 [Planctomycetota bacterium]